jgi:hypothetical protein
MAEINTLEQWYYDVPIVTRVWTTAAVITSVLVQCQVVTPFQLFFSVSSVFRKRQVPTSPLLHPPLSPLTPPTVLATRNNIPLLWPAFPRLHVPPLLHVALLSKP